MVSKIAVIALIAIVAAPILIGYGLNFETVQSPEYTIDDNPRNVTPLLASSTAYHYVDADPNAMNTQQDYRYLPYYVKNTHTYTGLFFSQSYNTTWNGSVSYSNLSNMHFISLWSQSYDLKGTFYVGSTPTVINNVTGIYYNVSESPNVYVYTASLGPSNPTELVGITSFNTSPGTNYVAGARMLSELPESLFNDPTAAQAQGIFKDISAGFVLPQITGTQPYYLPAPAARSVMTLNLDSGFDFSVSVPGIHDIKFLNRGTYWNVQSYVGNDWQFVCDLPITDGKSTYQLTLTRNDFKIDYVGVWPSSFGVANSYRTFGPYPATGSDAGTDYSELRFINLDSVGDPTATSPIMRIDAALVRSVTYPLIEDTVYDPATIKPTNPLTQINQVSLTGDSITFGGITYQTSKGTMRMGTHDIPLDGMMFDSVPNGSEYDNRINGDVISTTSTPSTIAFNGKWGIGQVVTASQTLEYKTVQKWVPGSFAWQGVDDNFILVGLIASVSAFIALGMYGRRSGAKVLPLLLVCGGAAFMFLLML